MTYYLRLGCVFVGVCTGALSPSRADSFDDTIIALMQKRHIPGLSLAIVQEGKIVKAKGYGVSASGSSTPVTEDTLFQAGSVSKPVAALAVLRLVDAGKLSLDADVNTALKAWKVPESEFTTTEKVTLRRLLSHTAGMTVHGFPGYAVGAPQPTLVQVLNGEKPANTPAIRPDMTPGSKWRYAGGGYTVMQQLVIDVTARPYPEFVRETVLKPLGMTASTYEQPLPEDLAAKTATGHDPGPKPVAGRWHIYPEMAAAGLWTTPSDLARFTIGVQQALAGKPDALLKPETARLMVTPILGGYGLGFSVAGAGKSQRFTHGGRDAGFDTQLTAYTETGRGAVIMINANDDSSFMNQVLAAVVKEYEWPDFTPYRPLTPIEDKEPTVTEQVKGIFEQAQVGTFERSLFTEKMAAEIVPQLPAGMKVLRAFGALKSITLVGKKNEGPNRSYRYHLIFENDAVVATCTYDQDGKISGFGFRPD